MHLLPLTLTLTLALVALLPLTTAHHPSPLHPRAPNLHLPLHPRGGAGSKPQPPPPPTQEDRPSRSSSDRSGVHLSVILPTCTGDPQKVNLCRSYCSCFAGQVWCQRNLGARMGATRANVIGQREDYCRPSCTCEKPRRKKSGLFGSEEGGGSEDKVEVLRRG